MVNLEMNEKNFNKEMFTFIKNCTCAFTGVKEIKKILLQQNFIELNENEPWNLEVQKKYFVTRNDASIIAFSKGTIPNFHIVCTHIDTPSFLIKPKNAIYEKNYLKINVLPYGGLLNYAWLDEPLSIAGRVVIKNKTVYKEEIIDLKRPLLCIPSVAIHQNENANDDLKLNSQIDMIPFLSLKEEKEPLIKLIRKELHLKKEDEVCDYDLFLYDTSHPFYFGINNECILSPRIDNLSCTFSALKSFLKQKKNNNTSIFCAFNSEEIGSLTAEGADSTFLMDTIKRITKDSFDLASVLKNSVILSADNTHATHPNHPLNSDVTNEALLNQGIVISKDGTSTTNAITSSLFKGICELAKVPYQDFVTKNDGTSGSTLSGISLRHVSIDSIDIGLCELAMHGAKEVIGSKDAYYLYLACKKFYEVTIQKKENRILLN